jgi:hypothetical protein
MLKSKIKELNEIDRATLMEAFNNETSICVKFGDGEFVGVNLPNNPDILETCGVWSYGKINADSPR